MQGYILNLLILVSISGILATSLNFIIGYAGIYSMAHAPLRRCAYAGALIAMHVSTVIAGRDPGRDALCAALVARHLAALAALCAGGLFRRRLARAADDRFTVFSNGRRSPAAIGGLTGCRVRRCSATACVR